MNVVSDHKVVIAIMGIRSVTWGENNHRYMDNSNGAFFVTIQYKGATNTFHYQTTHEAYKLFMKIRTAMDKSFVDGTSL